MQVLVLAVVVAAVAGSYGPPKPNNNRPFTHGGGGGTIGGFSVASSGSSSGSGCSGSSCDDYWWQGDNSPFNPGQSSHQRPQPQGRPQPHQSFNPQVAGVRPQDQQNLVQPPMGICPEGYTCINWQLCRNGYVIVDGSGLIDKRIKNMPPQIASSFQSCGGDMICCQVGSGHSVSRPASSPTSRPISSSISHQPPVQTTVSRPSPAIPSRPSPSQPRPSSPHSPVSIPSAPHSSRPRPSQPRPSSPHSPVSIPSAPHSSRPRPSQPRPTGSRPSVPSPSGGYAPAPHSPPQRPLGVTPVNVAGPPSAGLRPQASQNNFRPPRPAQPQPQPQPSQPRPVRPVSNPIGLVGVGSTPQQPMTMMGGMMMPMRSGSCSAGTYCVPQQSCNPYTGFIIRGNNPIMAVWPDSPTVPLLPCFVPDGSISDGVCCQEPHPNAGGAD